MLFSIQTDRHQWVRLGKHTSAPQTIDMGVRMGFVLSPPLPSPLPACTSSISSTKLPLLADDTTIIGLIQDGDLPACKQEVAGLKFWLCQNFLEVNTDNIDSLHLPCSSCPAEPLNATDTLLLHCHFTPHCCTPHLLSSKHICY